MNRDKVEIYIAEVVKRLPEKERDEVRNELWANIQDMLPEYPTEEEVNQVLNELGNPAKLANQYRQKPRYLISPEIYDDYIKTTKLLLPIVAGVLFAVGAILAIIGVVGSEGLVLEGGATASNIASLIGSSIGSLLGGGLNLAVQGALHVLFWVTLGFVIADRTNLAGEILGQEKVWTVASLPSALPNDKFKIPISDTIADMVATTVFSGAFVLSMFGAIPIVIQDNHVMNQYNLFNADFIAIAIPLVIVAIALELIDGTIKLIRRNWTPFVCVSHLINNILGAAIVIFLITRPYILDGDLRNYIEGAVGNALNLDTFNLNHIWFFGNNIEMPVTTVVIIVVLIITIVSSVGGVIKTVRNYLYQQEQVV